MGMPKPPGTNNIQTKQSRPSRRAAAQQFVSTSTIEHPQTCRPSARYDRQSKIDRSQNQRYESSLIGGTPSGGRHAHSTWLGCRQRFKMKPGFKRELGGNEQFGKLEDSSVVPFSQGIRFESNKLQPSDASLAGLSEVVITKGFHSNKYQEFSTIERDKLFPVMSSSERLWRQRLGPGVYDLSPPQHQGAQPKFSQVVRWKVNNDMDSICPGKYDQRRNMADDAREFILPVNECITLGFAAEDDGMDGEGVPVLSKPPRDKIEKHVREIKKGAMNKKERAQRRAMTARTHSHTMELVKGRHEKIHQEKMDRKVFLCGKWEQVRMENQDLAEAASNRKQVVTNIATNAFVLVTHGSRASCWDSILRQKRAQTREAQVLYNCARTIQRAYRMMQRWKKMITFNKMQKFRQSIRHFIFRAQFSTRMMRRKQSVEHMFRFAAEVGESNHFRMVCQHYRRMVLSAQNTVRTFLAVRRAQVDVAMQQFNTKAELYARKHSYCATWLALPLRVRRRVVWSDLRLRRGGITRELSKEEKDEAALDAVWELIHGASRASNYIKFRILAKEEHVLTVIEECVKQWNERFKELIP